MINYIKNLLPTRVVTVPVITDKQRKSLGDVPIHVLSKDLVDMFPAQAFDKDFSSEGLPPSPYFNNDLRINLGMTVQAACKRYNNKKGYADSKQAAVYKEEELNGKDSPELRRLRFTANKAEAMATTTHTMMTFLAGVYETALSERWNPHNSPDNGVEWFDSVLNVMLGKADSEVSTKAKTKVAK
jgi:hypothetical protein